ncbi:MULTISPECIES: nitrite reductase small subunit NirD [Mycobacterium]|uniref:Nitrite reductase small subunit n=2 Tax=Mycobacterium TaxID=1763 RepID=A0A1X1V8W6_MYCGS|nr:MULTISPECIES: nitrite reductase small subunit NirD [Mycobacterium]ETW25289.1 nitrite reductase [Mycobacterium gastri 'Wayne']KZS57346.1 nitrite reductase small subunit [Mycobacterium ostraviense]ORV65495.1 nitrite reductase small subunit [Mycobacterium gastri]UGT89959.1 nitrite reductase small subunit NirD [Mycobacterium ostraviense]
MTVLIERPRVIGADARVWTKACPLDSLLAGRGVAVLLPGAEQVALFLLSDGTLAAVSNLDPFAGAAVMSRGIIGDRHGEPTVASPLLKQVFSVNDGRCLDDESRSLRVYDVRVTDGIVEIARK